MLHIRCSWRAVSRLKSLLGREQYLEAEFYLGKRAGCCRVWCVRHRLYLHLVWTTRAREPLIDCALARFLCRFLRAMARKQRAYGLEIGMVQTHVHLLVRIH